MKNAVLDVPMPLLESRGAVCAEVVIAMAEGALAQSPADAAIAVTGVAGPEPDEDGNPIGLIFCAAALRGRPANPVQIECRSKDRAAILDEAMHCALKLLQSVLAEDATVDVRG